MGMIPYDVRSTVSRYSSCSEHSTTIHAFRSATNEGVSSRPMNDIRVLYLKQTKMTYFPKKQGPPEKIQLRRSHLENLHRVVVGESPYILQQKKMKGCTSQGIFLCRLSSSRIFMAERDVFYYMITCSFMTILVFSLMIRKEIHSYIQRT